MSDMGHAREAPEVSLEPGAEVVHELHALKVFRVSDIGLVGFKDGSGIAYDPAVGALPLVHDERAFGYVAAKSLILLVDGLPCPQTTA